MTKLDKKIENLFKQIKEQNEKINKIYDFLNKIHTQQMQSFRAKTERISEQTEQMLGLQNANSIKGRYRELFVLLMNEGYHTYGEIAKKMNISESRARAYVAELKNTFKIPLKQVRDIEGYKIGIDNSFAERILASR